MREKLQLQPARLAIEDGMAWLTGIRMAIDLHILLGQYDPNQRAGRGYTALGPDRGHTPGRHAS